MAVTRTLIQGGCVLTLGRSNLPEGDVLVDGDVVAEVGPHLRDRSAEIVDATGCIVMPGFVDSHRHLWETLHRQVDGDLDSRVAALYAPDDLYAATLLALLGAADSGTTTTVDWCDAAPTTAHVEAALQAHADSGMRTVFVLGEGPDGWEDGLGALATRSPGPLTTLGAGPAGAPGAGWDLARRLGLRIHHHVDPAADLAGHLDCEVTLVHGAHLPDAQLEVVSSSGAAVVMTPANEMAGGMGPPRVQPLIDRGIRAGLGVGSDRMSPGDMFAQMRAAIALQHATYFDLKLAGKAGLPRLLTTREVIRYATADGARAAGLPDGPGTIEPGRPADILVLRADGPNIHPINDAIGAVVWGMDTSNVDWVFVAGEVVKRHGSLVADVGNVRRLAETAHGRVTGGLAEGGEVA